MTTAQAVARAAERYLVQRTAQRWIETAPGWRGGEAQPAGESTVALPPEAWPVWPGNTR